MFFYFENTKQNILTNRAYTFWTHVILKDLVGGNSFQPKFEENFAHQFVSFKVYIYIYILL
jgi:hypothetical protein